ncbi:hypothetical protein MNODULE_18165 [Nitrospiraceae bacterium HYJII51-Mn-bac16s-1-B09]|uniref:HTH HARE-type domain-containing protein n=1 Tax=Candidatus Manganitrophus noduliformans TaxID=2606439 RepID=A0A7X6DT39_9BACT|nr:hypothetical protein [Candidatus Manganitrophus noduliformans]
MFYRGVTVEDFKDIITGLEQRIHVYKSKLQELQKKREKIEDEIKTVKKYLELAETLYRVEIEKVKWAQPSNQLTSEVEKEKGGKPTSEGHDHSKEILLEKTKYAGLSVPQATFLLLKEAGKPLHAKEIYQKLTEGGVRIRGKTPVTSVAISLSRDKRFKKIAPNTFTLVEETGPETLLGKNPAGS